MEEKKHIHYFDYLRVIAMFGVIYMHAASSVLRGEMTLGWHITNILTSIAFTAVPFFFMMSGYLLLSSDKTLDISVLMKKRLPRLAVPLAGWTLVAVIWQLLFGFDIKLFAGKLVSALNSPAAVHFWYMYTLIALYMISPFLRGVMKSLDRRGHIYLFTLASVISVHAMITAILPDSIDKYMQIDIINKLTVFSGHLSTFILGYYLGSLKKKIPNTILFGVALITWGIITVGTFIITKNNGEYTQTFQNQSKGFEILLAASLFLIFKQCFNKESKFLKTVPIVPLSLSIYFMHNILLSMMYTVGILVNSSVDPIWITAVNFLICFVVLKTVATVKPLCFIATGIPYKDACNSCNWIYTYRWIKAKMSNKNS